MTSRVLFRSLVIGLWCVCAAWSSRGSISAAEPIEDVLSATFRLTDGKTSATSFLVRTEGKPASLVLVTAAHFLEQVSGDECRLMLRARQPDDTYLRREHGLRVKDEGKPRWKRHPDQDIAALSIELPADVECTPFRLEQVGTEQDLKSRRIRVAQEAWIPGYPSQLEANAAGWPVLRHGTIASHPLVPLASTKTLIVNSSSFGGDSGAPVVVIPNAEPNAPPVVAGILVGMHRQTDRSSTSVEERTTHTPLDLSIVVQAPFIRETIELLLK